MTAPWTLKLARADAVISSLETEISAYLSGPAAQLDIRRTEDANTFELVLLIDTPPPDSWGPVIGDVLHNLRSALDSRTYAVVTAHATTPLSDDEKRRVVFPITDGARAFRKSQWDAGKCPQNVRDAFAAAQPWAEIAGLEAELPADAVQRLPLTILQRLSNIDKHRTVHLTVGAPDFLAHHQPVGVSSLPPVRVDAWPWTNGSIISRWTINGLAPGELPEIEAQFEVGLVEDVQPLQVFPVGARLRSLACAVEDTLWSLEQHGL